MYQNIIFTYKGKTSTISKYADGSIAWFTYGISQQMPEVEDYCAFVPLDQIAENTDRYFDEQVA